MIFELRLGALDDPLVQPLLEIAGSLLQLLEARLLPELAVLLEVRLIEVRHEIGLLVGFLLTREARGILASGSFVLSSTRAEIDQLLVVVIPRGRKHRRGEKRRIAGLPSIRLTLLPR